MAGGEYAIVGDQDEALSRRLKALACTAPLHGLDARKGRLELADADVYQMAEIALQAIDQVTIAMDFDRGADHDQVVVRLLPFVAAQAPERGRAEHEKIARWVLDNLINVGTTDRGFRSIYGVLGSDGVYQRRSFDFKLLIELMSPEGDVYLRASDEAINVLVGALDTDVESAQIAAEVKLENLIKRGRLSDARLAAEQARYRTVQYAETLRRKLDATRRDVRAVDWEHEVPDLIEDALAHIQGRFRAENAILKNITATRDDAEDIDRKRRAAELVEIVRDCIRRHTQLQARLLEAGATFRAEQDRQQFAGTVRRSAVDLFGQLLVPSLELSLADAAGPTDVFFKASAGVKVPSAPGLSSLVQMLLVPSAEREHLVGEVPELDLAPPSDADRYTEEHWQQSEGLLALDGAPRRLSGLLDEAREIDPDLPKLVALRVLHAFSPEVSSARIQGEELLLVAVDDGTPLDDVEFGGADLVVVQARVAGAGNEEGGAA
ncbi:hypothetical protein LFM09_03495 [Lentzea alba]|uniref:hypothetical protein n=1 Tax=Lentzea alba TaxID=2714351 RepID=UPI0039BFFFEE